MASWCCVVKGALNVILLLFVLECGRNIVEKMSLINATADWGLHGSSLWSHEGKGTNGVVSPILSSSHVVKFETTSVTAQEEFFPVLLTLTSRLSAHSLTAFAIGEISGHYSIWLKSISAEIPMRFSSLFSSSSNRCPRRPWKPRNTWSSRRWRDHWFTRPSRSSRVSRPGER